jgi:hypothetical protein
MHQEYKKEYPFQKIETYLPNNFETRCKHKSNLFSINIQNKNIEDLINGNDEETYNIKEGQRVYN